LLRLRTNAALDLVLTAGAALLAAMALAAVPWKGAFVRPRTLLDASTRFLVPAYELAIDAGAVIPDGASFAVRREPPNADSQLLEQRVVDALLPGRRIRPDPVLGLPAAADWPPEVDYLIVVGPTPKDARGHLVLQASRGTVWRRT
jgi:hypothetical protein